MLGLSSSKIKLHSVVNIHLLKDSSVLGQKLLLFLVHKVTAM